MKRFLSLTGFTLIELALVGVLILVIIAGSMPLFRKTFRGLELENSARNIAKIVRYGQERAIVEANTFKINFDFDKKIYWLTQLDKGEFKKIKNERFGEIFSIPEAIAIEGDKKTAIFYPDGRSEKLDIKLTSGGESSYVTVSGRPGYVRISKNAPKN